MPRLVTSTTFVGGGAGRNFPGEILRRRVGISPFQPGLSKRRYHADALNLSLVRNKDTWRKWRHGSTSLGQIYFDSSLRRSSWDVEELRHEVKESQGGVDLSLFKREDSVEGEGLGRRVARVDRQMLRVRLSWSISSRSSRAGLNDRNSILTRDALRGHLRQRAHDRLLEVVWTIQIEVEDSEDIDARERAVAPVLAFEIACPTSLNETSMPYDPRWVKSRGFCRALWNPGLFTITVACDHPRTLQSRRNKKVWLRSFGASDGNRTRVLSLRICEWCEWSVVPWPPGRESIATVARVCNSGSVASGNPRCVLSCTMLWHAIRTAWCNDAELVSVGIGQHYPGDITFVNPPHESAAELESSFGNVIRIVRVEVNVAASGAKSSTSQRWNVMSPDCTESQSTSSAKVTDVRKWTVPLKKNLGAGDENRTRVLSLRSNKDKWALTRRDPNRGHEDHWMSSWIGRLGHWLGIICFVIRRPYSENHTVA